MDSGEDVTYQFKGTDGETDLKEGDRGVWLRIDESAVGDHDCLLLINMDSNQRRFRIPAHGGKAWVRIIDPAAWAEIHGNFWGADDARETIMDAYEVAPWSIGVLEQVAAA